MRKIIIGVLLLTIAACSATPTRRAFKEGWRDANITSKVKWKLGQDDTVKAHNINVDTWRGVVTLNGRAMSEEEKAKAAEIAKNVKNVKEVKNYIDIATLDTVQQKVARENIPFSKPAGKFDKPQDITLPTVDGGVKKAETTATVSTSDKGKAEILEKDLEGSKGKRENGVSHEIGKELAVVDEGVTEDVLSQNDVTLKAEQELKELKAKKK